MRGYDVRWSASQSQFEVLGVEETISSDLWNPATERKSRSFRTAGKLDVRARCNGRAIIIDHKTCSEDISEPDATYWRQLIVESQLSHYMLLEWMNGRKADGGLWDVVRKPDISPRKLSAADLKQAIHSRIYFGAELFNDDIDALQRDGRESLWMYEARLAHDCTTERPERYFQRRAIPRLDDEIFEYASELWDHGQEMLHVRATERHSRNSGACMNYGRACTFLGICSGHDSPDSGKWRKKQKVHSELPELDGDGRDVLTNSRVRCFQTCRRKHLYQYEIGIERIEDEEAESLYFGTLWHEAQEAWWSTFITKEANGNANSDDAAN